MTRHPNLTVIRLLGAFTLGLGPLVAAPPNKAPTQTELTAGGNRLLAKYTGLLESLQQDIIKDIPKIDARKTAAYLKIREAEIAAEQKVAGAKNALGKVGEAAALVEHAKGKWIGGAEKGIAAAETALKKATTDAEREAARQDLAKWQADKAAGLAALMTRQEALDKAKLEEPQLIKALQVAQDELAVSQASTLKAVNEFNLEPFLTSDKLDDSLVKYVALAQATPRGLATFAQQDKEREALMEKLLADKGLMKQMLVADGAKQGQYGRAMEIYTAIRQASPKANEGVLQRLALAVSLEHAVPVKQDNPDNLTDAPATVDPVKRYLQVLRAKWVGDVVGEKRAFGLHSGAPGAWNDVALYHQRAIIEKAKAVALAAVGTDIGEANESKVKKAVKTVTVTAADRRVAVGQDGLITIPAVACSKPANSTARIRFMKSYLGGMQLHYNRMGPPEEFEYTFEAPAAGKYALSARVVTTSPNQNLMVAANDAKEPAKIAVPFTVGMWDQTAPVELALVKGRNVLRFSRETGEIKGLTIRDFTLTPLK